MTKMVNLHAAKTNLSRLVDEAVATKRRRTGFGADKGKIWIRDDFDAPLPDDVFRLFGAK